MIVVDVVERHGRICRFSVSGHAGYERRGRDVVCAAVSALVLNAVNSCEHLLGVVLPTQDDGERLTCDVPAHAQSAEVDLLMRSMVFGLEQTATAHPRHVRVQFHQENGQE
ncbi:MAG: ribosomal-processing cysteine protease Prp [Alicyclobacillus sp.]|nr:ribosomal-processing cysteine protease Prp [Alicyclobacillus sp.]